MRVTSEGILRLIFREERGIVTPGGKKKWNESTVLSILTNEKYKGDALLQKTFTVDFLTKKHKVNEGEVPQYYVEANHEAIIPPEEFEQVQAEVARRNKIGKSSGVAIESTARAKNAVRRQLLRMKSKPCLCRPSTG